MSRRTKLLILALFFVPLGIPALYLALTWSPENPLRVRLPTAEELRQSQPPVSTQPLPPMSPMVVENVSSVPMHVYSISEGEQFPTDGWSSYGPLVPAPHKPTREFLMLMRTVPATVIPPHHSIKVDVLHTNASLQHPSEKVACISVSRTKAAVLSILDWCHIHSPEALHFLIPDLQPDYHILPVHPPLQPAPPP